MPGSGKVVPVAAAPSMPAPLTLTEVVDFDQTEAATPKGARKYLETNGRESVLSSESTADADGRGANGGRNSVSSVASRASFSNRSTRGKSFLGGKSSKRQGSLVRTSTRARKEQHRAKFELRRGGSYMDMLGTTRRRIADMDRKRRFVLNPNMNKWIGMWDICSTLALLYTASFTPVETAFVPTVIGPACWEDGWFLTNRLLDVVFFVDMVLQFFVAYQEIDGRGNVRWIDAHDRIVHHYVTSWFPLDAFTIFVPLGFDLYSASPEMAEQSSEGTADMSFLRVLRVLRLIKLMRLVRASRLYERWKSFVTLSTGAMTMIQCLVMVLVTAHWYACAIALQATLHSSPLNTYLGAYNFCAEDNPFTRARSLREHDDFARMRSLRELSLDPTSPTDPTDPTDPTGASARRGLSPIPGCITHLNALSWYTASLSWSIMILTGTGGTDFYPSAESDTETVVVTVLVLVGALVWTRVLAMFCDVAANSNPGLTYFNQLLDGMNEYIETNNLPRDMGRRLREYLHQMKGAQLQEHAARALPSLSPALQIEVVLHCHRHWLDAIWFLKSVEEIVLVRLAMTMKSRVLAPGEVAPLRSMYVVSRGCVIFGGRVLSPGKAWGDDVILNNERHFLPYLARAMTYVDVQVLPRETLLSIVNNFPDAQRKLRRAALLLALRRFIVDEAKMRRQRAASQMGDMLDQVHSAAGKLTHKQATSVQMAVELVNDVHNERKADGGGLPNKDVELLTEAVAKLSTQQAAMMALAQGTQEQVAQLQASVDALTDAVNVRSRTDV